MKSFLIALKSTLAAILGGAAASAAQVLVSGQTITPATLTQAKGAAIGGAILTVAGLFAPQPHKD